MNRSLTALAFVVLSVGTLLSVKIAMQQNLHIIYAVLLFLTSLVLFYCIIHKANPEITITYLCPRR